MYALLVRVLRFGRSETAPGRPQEGIPELQGMELDEDLALPIPPGITVLTHRVSVARLQHVSNLAWCLGSWLPHLVSLAVFLIRLVRSSVHLEVPDIEDLLDRVSSFDLVCASLVC